MNLFGEKFREVFFSIVPIVAVVILLHMTVTPLPADLLWKFLLGSLLIVLGMPLFLVGIDLSISPVGESMSESLIQTNKLKLVLAGSFVLGFIISVAEPDLHILARQVSTVTDGQIGRLALVGIVSVGIALMLALGIYRVLKNISLKGFMLVTYGVIFLLALFNSNDFLAISFDASGSTTGSITVPFLLALAGGAANITKSGLEEDTASFGLLGIASTGAILGVMALGILNGSGGLTGQLPLDEAAGDGVLLTFLKQIPQTARESLLALVPVLVLFFIMNALVIKVSRQQMRQILIGLVYTITGLILFLTGVNAGFLEASRLMGYLMAANGNLLLVTLVGIVFGVLTIPAEPSVHVLTGQIEEETAGAIKARTVMVSLCVGVGLAVGLSILRILIPALELWHILLPGMLITVLLSFFVPDIFVGIAYDSGGVAAGTMTATFILPYAQGVAEYIPSASVLTDGFGIITLVAMTPLITVQILGLIYRIQTKNDAEEEEVYD